MKKSELNKIRNNKKITYCYIRKHGYYRPNSEGYTDFKCRAGVFTKEEAIREAEFCKDVSITPIDIQEHNEMIVKNATEILTRFIKSK